MANGGLSGALGQTLGTKQSPITSPLVANASVGTSGQVLTSRGANLSPQ